MNTDWQVGQTVCLMRNGQEIERRKVVDRWWRPMEGGLGFRGHAIFALANSDQKLQQWEWERRGWRLVQEGER